jgi:hypothetical protein
MSDNKLELETSGRKFDLMEMFPAFSGPEDLDPRHITLLELCAAIEVPFPAERNRSYGTWWHSLHEIGHWAVKPGWYVDYSRYLLDDLHTVWGSLEIPAGTVAGVDRDVRLPRIGRYVGGNDVIPEIALFRDPTPNELETRFFSLQVIAMNGWTHPFEDNRAGVTTGDEEFHKPASARVWARRNSMTPTSRRRCVTGGSTWRQAGSGPSTRRVAHRSPCPSRARRHTGR